MVPELRGGQEPPQHQRADGYPPGLRQHRAGRQAGTGRPGRAGNRQHHRGAAGREGADRRRDYRGCFLLKHQRPDRREPAARRQGRRRDHLRLHQHDRAPKDPHHQGVRRVHRLQNSGPGGERQLPQIQVGGLYLQICPRLHPRCLLRRAGTGHPAAAGPHAVHGA